METLSYVIIGAGNIFWTVHCPNLKSISHLRCVGLCDPAEAAHKRAQEEMGVPVFSSIDELKASGILADAVLNFSPPFARDQAIEVARHLNVPIFMEKPAATGLAAGKIIEQIIRKENIPTSVGFMFRYIPAVATLKNLLHDQPIVHILSEYVCPALTKWNLPDWFLMKDVSGGPIIDQAIHMIDLVRFIAGDIQQVMAVESNVVRKKSETCTVEDSSTSILKFANGATGAHIQSWVHDVEAGRITVWTPSDRLTLHMDGRLEGYADGKPVDIEPSTKPNHHLREMEVFFEAVAVGDFANILSSYDDALRSLAVAEAINTSMANNQPLLIND